MQMESKPVFVTYWLNRLQNLNAPQDIFVSLNPYNKPAQSKIHTQMVYEHPQFTAESVQAQGDVAHIQGRDGLWFCGAWMGYGFHEDGIRSGLEVRDICCVCLNIWWFGGVEIGRDKYELQSLMRIWYAV